MIMQRLDPGGSRLGFEISPFTQHLYGDAHVPLREAVD